MTKEKNEPDPGKPLARSDWEDIARRIQERMPGCSEKNCFACASNLKRARDFVREILATVDVDA